MKDRLTKLFTTFLAVVLLVGMSPAAATTAYAASWNSGGKSISSWWNNWFGSSNKSDSSNKNEQNDADVADNNQLITNDATSGGNTKDIVLTKTAKDKGIKDGNQIFDISLGVKGKKVNTARPVDVTLVIDTSGSMKETDAENWWETGTSKMDATKKAAKDFVGEVLKDSSSARISVVQFATDASAARFNSSGNYESYGTSKNSNQQYYSNNATQVTNAIDALNYKSGNDGGTNTEGGAVMAKIVTDSRNRSDADSIVIFLTDGVPTFYSNGGVKKVGGDGAVCKNITFEKATSAFANLKEGNQLYGIGFLTSFISDEKCW